MITVSREPMVIITMISQIGESIVIIIIIKRNTPKETPRVSLCDILT